MACRGAGQNVMPWTGARRGDPRRGSRLRRVRTDAPQDAPPVRLKLAGASMRRRGAAHVPAGPSVVCAAAVHGMEHGQFSFAHVTPRVSHVQTAEFEPTEAPTETRGESPWGCRPHHPTLPCRRQSPDPRNAAGVLSFASMLFNDISVMVRPASWGLAATVARLV